MTVLIEMIVERGREPGSRLPLEDRGRREGEARDHKGPRAGLPRRGGHGRYEGGFLASTRPQTAGEVPHGAAPRLAGPMQWPTDRP